MAIVLNKNFDSDTVGQLPSGFMNAVGTWVVSTTKPVSSPNTLKSSSNQENDVVVAVLPQAARLMSVEYKQKLQASITSPDRSQVMGAWLRCGAVTGAPTNGYLLFLSVRPSSGFVDVYVTSYKNGSATLVIGDRVFTTFANGDTFAVKFSVSENGVGSDDDLIQVFFGKDTPSSTPSSYSGVVLAANQPPTGHVGFNNSKEFHQADLAIDDVVVETFGLVAPTITVNPSDQTVPTGDPASFGYSATGTGPFTTQWQVSVGMGPATDIPGATSNPYVFNVAVGDNGNRYRAVVTGSVSPPATTAWATLTVDNTLPGDLTPVSVVVTGGNTVDVSFTDGSPVGDSYGIQVETPSGAGNWTTPTNTSVSGLFQVSGLSPATQYRARIRAVNGAGNSNWVNTSAFTTDNIGTGGGTLDPPIITSGLKRWNGSAWVAADLYRWTGLIWAPCIFKRWNGSNWV